MRSETSEAEIHCDVCVIGSGPAGMTVAGELSRRGVNVVVLEAGEQVPLAILQDDLDGPCQGPVLKDAQHYLRASRRAQVGGTGAIWGTGARPWLTPFTDLDLQERSWVNGSAWPIPPQVIRSYTERAVKAMSIPDFTQPADFEPFDDDEVLVPHPYHFPAEPGILLSTFMRSVRAGALRLESGTTVVAFESCHGRLSKVRAVRLSGNLLSCKAEVFVLAAGGIENARMLMLARDQRTPPIEGLRDLAHFFMEHFHVPVGTMRCVDPERLSAFAAVPSAGSQPLRMLTLRISDEVQRTEHLLNASLQLIGRPPKLAGVGVFDMFLRSEQAPNRSSQVSLHKSADRLGRRRAALTWSPSPIDWDSIVRSSRIMAESLRSELGAEVGLSIRSDDPWPVPPLGPEATSTPAWGHHHMGTTRMSGPDRVGVVDETCRVHDVDNLYVAGSSVFPTSSFANPTLMIVALSIRLADHVVALLHSETVR